MSASPNRAGAVLAAGALLGVLGNALLRAPGTPGLNLMLWSAAVALAAWLLHRLSGLPLSGEARALLGVGLAFSLALVWRDAPALKLLAIACIATAYALPAFRSGAAWIRRSSVGGYLGALVAAGLQGAGGAALAVSEVDWTSLAGERRPTVWQHAAAAARGLVLAVPAVVVFGALFVSADAVFARMVTDAVRIDLDVLASHIVLTGFLAWLTTGYLRSFVTPRAPVQPPPALRRVRVGVIEAGVLLGVVNLLFVAFVLVQFRYLFGGAGLVEVTPGLTYAEYARRGFFELVFAVALTLPLLLSVDWLLRSEGFRGRVVFRAFAGAQVVLVLAVMLSALQRMRLYQAAYGLTEARFYASALLALLAVVLLTFATTVLRGRRAAFAFSAMIATFVGVAALFAINPDAVIARTNLARAQQPGADARFDAAYIGALSGDAVPIVLAGLPTLAAPAQCAVARRLLRRWPPHEPAALRAWSWSSARAASAVRREAAALHAIVAREVCG